MTGRTLVLGEALVDIVERHDGERREYVGGSPLNVALGLARLGEPVDFATRFGDDERGRRIAATLAAGEVALVAGSATADHTSTALAQLDAHAAATYIFDLTWDLARVSAPLGTHHVHTGSIAAVLEPGGSRVVEVIRETRERATVSYDPNVRVQIMTDLVAARVRIEEAIGLSDVVKASDEDLAMLYPDLTVPEVLRHWGGMGPAVLVVTRGPDGVVFSVTRTGEVASEPTRATTVVDTVGAGDSFMAGLVSGLLTDGLLGGPEARARLANATLHDIRPAIERGLACSGITVGHAGAYAPGLDEL